LVGRTADGTRPRWFIGRTSGALEQLAALVKTATNVRFGRTAAGLRVGAIWKDKNKGCPAGREVDTSSGPAIIRA